MVVYVASLFFSPLSWRDSVLTVHKMVAGIHVELDQRDRPEKRMFSGRPCFIQVAVEFLQ